MILDNSIECVNYLFELNESGLLKFGIATDIETRYSERIRNQFKNKYITDTYTNKKCFLVEQIIKNKYKNNHIDYEERVEGFGWTETLKDVSFDEIKSYMDELLLLDEEELLGMHYAIRGS